VGVSEVFQFYKSGQLVGEAGVLPADSSGAATILVSMDGQSRNTGVALVNLGVSDNLLNLTLYDRDGTIVATSSRVLHSQNQIAQFIDQFDGFDRLGMPFEGSLSISGLNRFAVLTLLLDGAQLSAVPALPARMPRNSNTIDVPAVADIALAGMPSGFTIRDVTSAPFNSPLEAGLALIPGGMVQFSASGTVSGGRWSTGPVGPEGWQSGTIPDLWSNLGVPSGIGVSDVTAPENALVGVFIGPSQPLPPLPPALNFSGGAGVAVTLQPLLQQPFFIGSGKTSTGQARSFMVPDGATRLFLAPMAYSGSKYVTNRSGSFHVTASITQ
jgi:hypothetical protein